MRSKIGIGKGEVLVLRIFECYGSYIGDGQMLAICNINLFMSNIWLGLIKTMFHKSHMVRSSRIYKPWRGRNECCKGSISASTSDTIQVKAEATEVWSYPVSILESASQCLRMRKEDAWLGELVSAWRAVWCWAFCPCDWSFYARWSTCTLKNNIPCPLRFGLM